MIGRMHKQITVRLDNDKAVTADCEICWVHDQAYGADADGNRGVPMTEIEEVAFDPPTEDDDGEALEPGEIVEATKLIEKAGYDAEIIRN